MGCCKNYGGTWMTLLTTRKSFIYAGGAGDEFEGELELELELAVSVWSF